MLLICHDLDKSHSFVESAQSRWTKALPCSASVTQWTNRPRCEGGSGPMSGNKWGKSSCGERTWSNNKREERNAVRQLASTAVGAGEGRGSKSGSRWRDRLWPVGWSEQVTRATHAAGRSSSFMPSHARARFEPRGGGGGGGRLSALHSAAAAAAAAGWLLSPHERSAAQDAGLSLGVARLCCARLQIFDCGLGRLIPRATGRCFLR
ncbi:hypothetical protein MPTK1_7g04120 [Marchantia polymorpha subsp. ruderalis]|uniref:Uncharacterized protein n=2 Tax=Marchantia polymorpha TaxID=3197 RepID=A0AAF6BVZ5_MARPO|nr:hypothetical protein MARPO_0062s0113 [Marchantia polymorpha]BBN16179.1 hypothetical protein Mp_7g04120 [Marchantia polymorpha subsp. ruderalis]|eukprot:PTQ36703.1 hypothetical protein MARPO_0062s0113 [Marchantia polymorpha]